MRVGVFIDGQNITIGARYAFGHGNMHPLLLGRALAGDDELIEIRYATGIPDPDVDEARHAAERRRHELMVATDVVVLEKTLRYRWEWDIRDRDLGDPRDHRGETRTAKVKSRRRGEEKGIDVWLALDALTMCTRRDIDRVIIASADTDLDMVPAHVRMIEGHEHTEVVQASIVGDGRTPRRNAAYDEVVAIDRTVFDVARDDFDYDHDLDEGDIARFISSIDADHDGIRDPSTPRSRQGSRQGEERNGNS